MPRATQGDDIGCRVSRYWPSDLYASLENANAGVLIQLTTFFRIIKINNNKLDKKTKPRTVHKRVFFELKNIQSCMSRKEKLIKGKVH